MDASCLVALALNEPTAAGVRVRMAAYDQIVASNLVEAELRSACARDGIALSAGWLGYVEWGIQRAH